MKHPIMVFCCLALLPACPTSTSGDRLCVSSEVMALCGIPDDECQAIVAADAAFDASAVYIPPNVDVRDGSCVLFASSLGRPIQSPFDPPQQDLAVDLGPVREGGARFDGDDDGLDAEGEASAGTDDDSDDTDDDGVNDADEVDCGSDPLDPAVVCG